MKHRIFKFISSSYQKIIIWVPTLGKLYAADIKHYDEIPDFVEDDEEDDFGKTESNLRYQFTGVTLFLTTKCNLHCSYCYEGKTTLKGKVMPKEIAYAAIDYILECAKATKKKACRLSFFGGEPTIAWPLLCEVTDYFKKESIKNRVSGGTRITTNGVFSKDKASWLIEHIDGITVSMDGMKEIHDRQRSGSFDKVFEVATFMYNKRKQKLSFRITITQESVNFIPQICKFFGENFPGTFLNFEPVEPSILNNSVIPDHNLFFKKFLEGIAIAKLYNVRIRTSVSMINAPHRRFCGIGKSNFMVLPDGRVTACNRMIGTDNISEMFIYGYYNKEQKRFVFDDSRYALLEKLTVDAIKDCSNCLAQFSCCGDCPATKAAIYQHKNEFWRQKSPYCKEIQEFTKKLLEFLLFNGPEGVVLV